MTFAHTLPIWAFGLVALTLAAVSWYAYRRFSAPPLRRFALMALRFSILLLIVLVLMRPIARSAATDPSDAIVPILVDTSRSMGIDDTGPGLRRIDHARSILERRILPALAGRFQTEVIAFGEKAAPVAAAGLSATSRRSDLAGALRTLRDRYAGRPVAGIVLVSDGGDTSATAEAALQHHRIGPIYPLGVGSLTVGRDREVLSVTTAETALDDSRVDLAVSAVSHGHGTAPIELRLLENGRVTEVRRASPAAEGTPVREVFQVFPKRGAPTLYSVEIPAASGELVPENNARSTLVQPPARPRRVLIVEGAPGFEHSFFKRALLSDPGLEVDSVVRKGKNEQGSDTFYVQAARSRSGALTTGYPGKVEELFTYDALVLANVDGDQLTRSQLEATRDFVARRGGGLLVLGAQSFLRRGLRDTALEEVLPIELNERAGDVLPAAAVLGRNRVTLTSAGEVHPVMQLAGDLAETRKRWEAIPALASIAPVGGARAGASILALTSGAGGAPRALVAVQRFGDGRAMAFTGEAAWRWRMMLPAADRSYDIFWRQAIRWLGMAAPDPMTVLVPAGASPGDDVPLRVVVRSNTFEPVPGAAVDVRVTAPDGALAQFRAAPEEAAADDGRYIARYEADAPGIYRVTVEAKLKGSTIGSSTTSMLVGGADLEMTDPRLNAQLLQRVAYASGGRVLQESELQTLPDLLQAGVPAAMMSVRRDLWHNVWSFATIVALLGAEWVLRRRWGLR